MTLHRFDYSSLLVSMIYMSWPCIPLPVCVYVCCSLLQGKPASALFIIQTVADLALALAPAEAARCRCAPTPSPVRPSPLTLIQPLHPVRSLLPPSRLIIIIRISTQSRPVFLVDYNILNTRFHVVFDSFKSTNLLFTSNTCSFFFLALFTV